MDYLLKITNQEAHQTLNLYVMSEADLTTEQIENIKKFSTQIFSNFKNQASSKVSFDDLKNCFEKIPDLESASSHFLVTVRKMKTVGPVKNIHRSCAEIYRKIIDKKPSIPLKLTWGIFIAPFVTLYRFFTQDRHLSSKLHKVFGTEMETQKQFVSQLKRAKQRISPKKTPVEEPAKEDKKALPIIKEKKELTIGSEEELIEEEELEVEPVEGGSEEEVLSEAEEEPPSEVEKILDEAYLIGKQLLSISSKNPNVDEMADPIATQFLNKISKKSEEQMLGMIPISLSIEGTKIPLMVSFRKEKDKIYVDIKGLPPGKKGGLHDSFLIPLNKSKEAIPYIVKALFRAYLADIPKKTNIQISSREQIRLSNLDVLGIEPFPKAGSQTAESSPSQWLNEMLCNFAIPLETETMGEKESKGEGKGEDLLMETFLALEKSFPDAPSIDKIEWVLASIEEEYQALLPVIHRLKPKDQLYFFERLEDHMRLMQKRLSHIKKDETDSIFNVFFTRLETLKEKRTALQNSIQKSQQKRLSSGVPSQTKCKTKALIPDFLTASKTKKSTSSDQVNAISAENLQQLAALKDCISHSRHEEALQQLTALHAAADRLIDKKQYLLAQELALLTLGALPVPTDAANSFWGNRNQQGDGFSKTVTALVKDVWESSLRLNYTHLQPDQLIQLFKAQTINFQILSGHAGCQLDTEEMKKIIHLHPHLRFGWKPEQQKELKEIKKFMEGVKDDWRSRRDTGIGGGWGVYHRMQRSSGDDHGDITDFARLQVMISCLMKPDHCLWPFYGEGRLQQAQGLSWLDQLEARAMENGAKTREEITDEARLIRLKEVQEKLKSMGRLELGTGRFVTEHDCITIVDASSLLESAQLAYLPNGLGLPPDYEAKYGTTTNQKNTTPLVGYTRGQERFLEERDGNNVARVHTGLRDCLSPQRGYTEPTLLQANLQKAPRGQVSQVENYLLEAIQSNPRNLQVGPGSIVEGLNILFSERNLADPEVQKTVMLILTRSFLLEQALQEFPEEMEAVASQLLELMQRQAQDPVVFPFLLQVGQVIKGYADSLSDLHNHSIDRVAAQVPSFANEITIGKVTQTGEKWLESILKDPEKERSAAAITYLYCLMDRPIKDMSHETISLALFSAPFFGTVADSLALPQFNRVVEKWINQTLLPELGAKFQEERYPLDEVFGKWMEQAHPAEFAATPSPWKVSKNQPLTVENGRIKVVLPTLQILSKETKKPIGVPKVTIPEHVRRSQSFLKLFGNASPQAELTRDDDPNHFIYTFHYGKMNNQYRAVYDQTTGKIDIYCQLPVHPQKKKGAKEWFLHVQEFTKGKSETALETCMSQQGIWVNSKKPKKGYLFSSSLSEVNRREMYSIELNGKGLVESAASVKGDRTVALLTPKQTEEIVPFANGKQTLVLLSSWPFRRIKEVRSLDQKYTLKKGNKDKWNYSDSRLGEGLEWNIDLSRQYKASPQGSQEKRFFELLGGDQQQFLLPFSQGKERQFLVLPYEITSSAKQGLHFKKESLDSHSNQTPITLSFGKEGELKGSPSTFLYLSYYFCMKKDYDRALFYLKKAKQMPAQSEQEKVAFEKIATLFDKVPFQSFPSLVFQLKAQLAIREIKKTQFSRTIYEREGEGEFVKNTAHVTRLYRQYRAKLSKISPEQMEIEKLKEGEEFLLQRIEWSSFEHWIERQKEMDLASRSGERKPLQVEDNSFFSTKLDKTKLANFPTGILSATVLLAADLDRSFSDEELVNKGIPESEFLVRHFFHFAKNILSTDSPQKILNYLLTIPRWQLEPPEGEEDKMITQIAEELRTLLTFACVHKVKEQGALVDSEEDSSEESSEELSTSSGSNSGSSSEEESSDASKRRRHHKPKPMPNNSIDLKAIGEVQRGLPFWGRQNFLPIRFVLNNWDLQTGTASNIQSSLSPIQRQVGGFIGLLGSYADKTVGEILEIIPPKLREENKRKKEEDPPGGVTMQAIYEHFQNLPPEHFYLPLEVAEIPRLIEEETADKNKARDMSTYFRESEARNFPVLQIRNLSETMREIDRCEKAIAAQGEERARRKEEAKPVKINPDELIRIQTLLTSEAESFSKLSEDDKNRKVVALADLNRKYESAKRYFDPEKTATPSAKEEYEQLCLGFETARDTLQEELNAKSKFSSSEIKALENYLEKHVFNPEDQEESLVKLYHAKKEAFLNKLKEADSKTLPNKLRKMLEKQDLYTDFDLIHATQKLYKDPRYAYFFASSEAEWEQVITETLLLLTALQQFNKAYDILVSNPNESSAKKALEMIQGGLTLDRYFDAEGRIKDPVMAKKCLVGEARAEIIYRPGQRDIIHRTAEDPQQWLSLRMGLGKTSYAIPTIAEVLSEQGKAVVITVPDKLLKSNRKDIDKSTRMLFDQAGMEFSLPLAQDLPFNFLAEKLLQLQEVFKNKGYVITTVEELATLHDTCILCEEEKHQIVSRGNLERKDEIRLFQIEMRLHYYRKITRLLNGEATGLNLPSIFFGDETDDTHHITHEVSIAIAEQIDPSKPVREVARTIMDHILSAANGSSLYPLRMGLWNNTYPVMTEQDVQGFMETVAKDFLNSDSFLNLLHPDHSARIRALDKEEWSAYLIGKSDQLPKGLPDWDGEDEAWVRTQTNIACAKQLLTSTLPNFLAQKSGNDLGLSDYLGFVVVPKVTKNESEGIRYGDEFEMILAQYLGYLEFLPCLSLTEESTQFLNQALKTLREKSPAAYRDLLADYHAAVERLRTQNKDIPELFEFLQWTEGYKHRWNILDNVVFDGGYIKRYKEQVNMNVQEIFHGKPSGGVTGTLDPYVLPYISDAILLHQTKGKKTSTREVETETFLRMGLNLPQGLDEAAKVYSDERAEQELEAILTDKETKALINSNGATSEGMNTLSWIEKIRKSPSGKKRSYLFMHPMQRIPYLWSDQSTKAVPYKGQPLPDNTICTYAPSDVRGVDLPIRKGKVHMLANPTASPQEMVQSLYRARQLGGDHQLILHVPISLQEKIADQKKNATPVTYGDVLVYLVNRSIPGKLDLDLTAQLKKVQFELKTAITSYLKETNPDFDQNAFWTKKNLDSIGAGAVAQAALFKEVREFYIQSKDIDFQGCFTPRQFIEGTQKVLDEYTALQTKIREMLEPIKEASLMSAACLLQIENREERFKADFQEKFQSLVESITKAKAEEDLPLYQESFKIMMLMMTFKGSIEKGDFSTAFDTLADVHLLLGEWITQLKALPPESQGEHVDAVLDDLRAMEKIIPEFLYGKGKSHLYNTLRQLDKKIDLLRESFNVNIEEHKKYLPEQTTSNRVGCAGSNEQVKEMQQQKTKEVEKTEEDPLALSAGANRPARSYRELDRYSVLGGNEPKGLDYLGQTPPFNQFYISKEARDLLRVLTIMTGDPLVYIAVDTSLFPPRITLISKTDYHKVVKEQFKHKYSSFQNLTVYQPTPSGFRWVGGGTNSRFDAPIPEDILNSLMTIKAFLGYKDEFASKSPVVNAWRGSLGPGERQAILDHIASRGSPAQRKIFQDCIGD